MTPGREADSVRHADASAPAAAVAEAERVLRQNWHVGERDGTPFSYSEPSPGRYPWQWYWDSCFAAIVWRRFEPARARLELESLLAAQRPNGFIGHTIFWGQPVSLGRLAFYNVASRSSFQTETIQPPLLAWAWRIAVGDPALEPRIGAQMDWLAANRDLEGDGLLWIVQPDESGLDASPKFDALMGWRASGLPGFIWHIHELRKGRFQLDDVVRRGGFCVQEVLTTVAHAASLHSLARLSGDDAYRRTAERTEAALFERCWDERRGLFFDLAYPSGEPQRVSTWASLAPLALPNLPREMAARLAEQLADRCEYALPWPVPSTAASEPAFRRRTGPIPRYWRGETWLAGTWLLHRGLRQHGFHELARTLARQGSRLVAGRGLREYYDPIEGTPQGAQHFGMSALVLDLERQA
jgi:hypothetical protein